MKTITVKDLDIQFDIYDDGADQHTALDVIETINEVLGNYFSGFQPQIMISSFDGDNVEIEDSDNES